MEALEFEIEINIAFGGNRKECLKLLHSTYSTCMYFIHLHIYCIIYRAYRLVAIDPQGSVPE